MRAANEALIVIDVQNDFCPGGALAVAEGDLIVEGINAQMDDFAAVVLTQDFHPMNHSSFADNHEGAAPYSVIEMPYGAQVLWPRHCVAGTEGADFHPDLRADSAHLILRKGFRAGIDSYSAFYENDRETVTGLDGYLRARGIDSITLVGLATDYCVHYSAMDAIRLGYKVTVDTRLSRGIDLNGSLADALAAMAGAGVVLL